MKVSEPSDEALVRELSRLFDDEVRRARKAPPAGPRARVLRASTYQATAGVMVAVVFIATAVLLLRGPQFFVGTHATATPSALVTGRTASPAPTEMERESPQETATPTVVGTPGPLVRGVPKSFGGQPVLWGRVLKRSIAVSTDDSPFLAGGWFLKGDTIRFCAIPHPDPAVDICYAFPLYADARGGGRLWIFRGDEGLLPDDYLHQEVTRPVILLIHTHDVRCEPDDKGCELRPVLLQVVWMGNPIATD